MYDTITFLTDFGLRDDFVGVCRGVMRRIAPRRRDHRRDATASPPQEVARGALVLARALPYLPAGVHLAVVDPGVGGERRAVAIRTGEGRVFVGPDNGLLTLAADRARDRGGPVAHEPPLPPRARLAHLPRARHLRARRGAPRGRGAFRRPRRGGRPGEARPPRPAAARHRRRRAARYRRRRRPLRQPGAQRRRRPGRRSSGSSPGVRVELWFALNPYYAVVAETYADAARGELILYEDSYGAYAIAISGGNAASLTEAASGDEVRIRRAEGLSAAGATSPTVSELRLPRRRARSRFPSRNAPRRPEWMKVRAPSADTRYRESSGCSTAPACTRSARRRAARTSPSAGAAARRPSRSWATPARAPAATATSTRGPRAARPTRSSRCASPRPRTRWGSTTSSSPRSTATTSPTGAPATTRRRSARSSAACPGRASRC